MHVWTIYWETALHGSEHCLVGFLLSLEQGT